jgi:ribosomal protein L40E
MKTCPKCGAENLQTAASCRMCAVPLEAPDTKLGIHADVSLGNAIPSPVLVSGAEPLHQHAPASTYAGHIVCQACKTVNEPDFVFCEQCGARLTRPVPQTAERPAPSAPSPRPAPPASAVRDESGSRPITSDRAEYQSAPPQSPARPQDRSQGSRRSAPPELPVGGVEADKASRGAGGVRIRTPAERAASINESAGKVVCERCGNRQPAGGLYCGICGSVLSPTDSGARAIGGKRGVFLELITESGEQREIYPVRSEIRLGRVDGDVTFSHDGYMSSRHARIVEREGRYFLVDEGSRNGTFVRINGEVEIKPGDVFLIGKQVLRFDKE